MTIRSPPINYLRQRLSKDFHDKLTIDTTASWGAIEPSVKVNLRRELKELCAENGLFTERDPEPAMEWRLYQLQRNRRAESRKGKPGWSSFSVHIPEANTEVVTATESVSESPTVPETSDSAHKGGHYDPVRDV